MNDSLIDLGDDLDLVVAEGVENEVQFERLNELGRDLAQGFHFFRSHNGRRSSESPGRRRQAATGCVAARLLEK